MYAFLSTSQNLIQFEIFMQFAEEISVNNWYVYVHVIPDGF